MRIIKLFGTCISTNKRIEWGVEENKMLETSKSGMKPNISCSFCCDGGSLSSRPKPEYLFLRVGGREIVYDYNVVSGRLLDINITNKYVSLLFFFLDLLFCLF